jgi:serine/threonine protein phosphatase PrpC
MKVHGSGITSAGPSYEKNEDVYHISNDHNLYLLCDGGGRPGSGGRASQMGAETLAESVISEMKRLREIDSESEALLYAKGAIKSAFQVATKRILECMDSELGPLRSTATVVLVYGSHAIVAHVGNSRVWLVRDRQAHQLTRDHTVVQEMIDEELIDPVSARGSQFGHVLTRSLGASEHVRVDTLVFRLIPGDLLLLTSDGFSDILDSTEELNSWIEGSEDFLCSDIMQQATAKNQKDDITILAVEVEQGELSPECFTAMNNIALMRKVFLFRDLPLREILLILSKVWTFSVVEGDEVLHEGDYSDVMYVILDGNFKVRQKDVEIAVLGVGDHFGEMSLLHESPRSASVLCSKSGELLALERRVFERLIKKNTHLGVRLLAKISAQLCRRLERANVYVSLDFGTS